MFREGRPVSDQLRLFHVQSYQDPPVVIRFVALKEVHEEDSEEDSESDSNAMEIDWAACANSPE